MSGDNQEYKYSVECQEDSACPTAEESLPIEVVVDAIHKFKYENYTSSFYIRDISEFETFICISEGRKDAVRHMLTVPQVLDEKGLHM